MSVFDPIEPTSYSLTAEYIGGVLYVDGQKLLDLLEQRATLILRNVSTPNLDTRIADFERGRFIEAQELYKELKTHVRR